MLNEELVHKLWDENDSEKFAHSDDAHIWGFGGEDHYKVLLGGENIEK